MQFMGSDDPCDLLSIPSLNPFLAGTDGLFSSNPLFGGGAGEGDSMLASAFGHNNYSHLAPGGLYGLRPSMTQGTYSGQSSQFNSPPSTAASSGAGSTLSTLLANQGAGAQLSTMDKLFYNGTPESGNSQSLYIQVPASENEGGVSTGSEFWVSVTWHKVAAQLVNHPEVLAAVLKQVNEKPDLRKQAVEALGFADNQHQSSAAASALSGVPMEANGPTAVMSVAVPNVNDNATRHPLTPIKSDTSAARMRLGNGDQIMASPIGHAHNGWQLTAEALVKPSFQMDKGSDTPDTPAGGLKPWDLSSHQLGNLDIALPPMPRAQSPNIPNSILNPRFESVDGQAVSVMVARQDTIDPFLLAQRDVEHNTTTLEYVWSPSDTTLYKAESLQGQQAATEIGSIRLVFPPRTMLLAQEKDGSQATPAYSNAHPHSNEWLKAQVCHRSCPYRAGTASLKRPKTVREHFRKCVYLDEHHPLKVVSALQLAVLERESQGLLPNRRRARVIRMASDSVNKIY